MYRSSIHAKGYNSISCKTLLLIFIHIKPLAELINMQQMEALNLALNGYAT